MKKSHLGNVIIIGGNHHNGLGLLRSLGEVSFNLYYIAYKSKKSFVTKSKYLKGYWYAENMGELMAILNTNFRNVHPTIILPANDECSSILDQNYQELSRKFIIPHLNYSEGAITKYMDKQIMNDYMRQKGFLVPFSFEVSLVNKEWAKEFEKYNKIEYPCIIKPLQSKDGDKGDIIVCNDKVELLVKLKLLTNKYKKVIIQEFIEKEGEIGIPGIVTIRNEVIIPGVINKIRDSLTAPGSTTYAEIIRNNYNIDLRELENILNDLKYVGMFDFEFIYSKEKIYFIEVNFRNGAYGYATTKAGVNLAKLWCLSAVNKDISNEPKSYNKQITFMQEFSDIKHVFNGNISFFKWLKQFLCSKAYLIFNIKDLKPFIYKFIYK